MGTFSPEGLMFESDEQTRQLVLNALHVDQRVLYAVDCALKVLPAIEDLTQRKKLKLTLDLAKKSVLVGGVSKDDLRTASYAANQVVNSVMGQSNNIVLAACTVHYAVNVANEKLCGRDRIVTSLISGILYWVAKIQDWKPFVDLIRQTQPEVPFYEHYKTPDTLGLAKDILNDNFDLMPILADALLDLGCPEKQVIHVRLGKGYSNWALFHLTN